MSLATLRTRLAAAIQAIGVQSLHVYGGLLLAGAGGALISPRWTLVAAGAVLVYLGARR